MNTRKLRISGLLLTIFAAIFSSTAIAQNQGNSDDYNKVEGYGGYSLANVQSNVKAIEEFGMTLDPCSAEATPILGPNYQTSFCKRPTFNGFDASVTYNFTRYVGVKGNITGHFRSHPYTDEVAGAPETITKKERITNFLFGVQIKDNSKKTRFKPFFHVLAGAARYKLTATNVAPAAPMDEFKIDLAKTVFAMKVGGGIDVRVNRRVDIRLFEINYNPLFFRNYAVTGDPYGAFQQSRTTNNFTFGFGIAFH